MSKQWPLVFRQGTVFNFDGHIIGYTAVNGNPLCPQKDKTNFITKGTCFFDAETLREIADYLDKCDKE